VVEVCVCLPIHNCVGFVTQGVTALICASANGHVEVVKFLVALPGIDYNHKDNEVCGCVSKSDDVFDSNPFIRGSGL
jgi:ankyrin repeat protein